MLSEAPPGRFRAACDKCSAAHRFEAPTFDGARAGLKLLGWMECAVKGKATSRWIWWCPECKPQPPTSFGRSTI